MTHAGKKFILGMVGFIGTLALQLKLSIASLQVAQSLRQAAGGAFYPILELLVGFLNAGRQSVDTAGEGA